MRVLKFTDGSKLPVIKVTRRAYITASGELSKKEVNALKESGYCQEYVKVYGK